MGFVIPPNKLPRASYYDPQGFAPKPRPKGGGIIWGMESRNIGSQIYTKTTKKERCIQLCDPGLPFPTLGGNA